MTSLILTQTGYIARQFASRDEAEEWMANNANEDGILTETAWSGQAAHLQDDEFIGWGIVGAPNDQQEDVLVDGPSGKSLDVTGYHAEDYWENGEFRGPDPFGIVPMYRTANGAIFPADATQYPYLA